MLDDKYLKEIVAASKKVLLLSQKNKVKCELIGKINLGLSVNVRMQDIDTLEFNNNKQLHITVYDDHKQGTVSTTELDYSSLDKAVQKAISIAKFTDTDPYSGLADLNLMAKKIENLDLYHPIADSNPQFAVNLAKNCEKVALANVDIKNSEGATFSYNYSFVAIANSNDFINAYPKTSYSLGCTAIASAKNSMQRDGDYTYARNFNNLINPEIIGERAASYAQQKLGAKKLPAGKSKVIFMPEAAAELICYLIDAISGHNIVNKSSFLLDKLHQKILPEFITIIDEPLIKQGIQSAAFDSDGLATKKQFIVKQGTLSTYLLNNYFAKKLQTVPTGHASGIHNLFVINNNIISSLEDIYYPLDRSKQIYGNNYKQDRFKQCANLIKIMNTGLIVTETIGHGVNLVTGDYSKGVFGFWVKNGEIIYPVEEATIAGNLHDFFRNILAVDQNFNLQNNIITGSILIDDVMIGGN